MTIAAIAYRNLTPQEKATVNEILMALDNPDLEPLWKDIAEI